MTVSADHLDPDQTLAKPQCRLHGIGQPTGDALLDHKSVDDDLDGVLFVLVEGDLFTQVVHFAVNPDPYETVGLELAQLLAVFPLATPDNRSQEQEFALLRQVEDLLNHLLSGLRGNLLFAGRAVHPPDTGIKQAQVIVNLGDCTDG